MIQFVSALCRRARQPSNLQMITTYRSFVDREEIQKCKVNWFYSTTGLSLSHSVLGSNFRQVALQSFDTHWRWWVEKHRIQPISIIIRALCLFNAVSFVGGGRSELYSDGKRRCQRAGPSFQKALGRNLTEMPDWCYDHRDSSGRGEKTRSVAKNWVRLVVGLTRSSQKPVGNTHSWSMHSKLKRIFCLRTHCDIDKDG